MFYFKNRDPWSEPLGVVVLEQCQVRIDPPMASPPLNTEGHYPFYLGKYFLIQIGPEKAYINVFSRAK